MIGEGKRRPQRAANPRGVDRNSEHVIVAVVSQQCASDRKVVVCSRSMELLPLPPDAIHLRMVHKEDGVGSRHLREPHRSINPNVSQVVQVWASRMPTFKIVAKAGIYIA